MARILMSSLLLIGLTGPIFAQQAHALSEQEAQAAAEAMNKRFVAAYNGGDAAALAGLFAEGALYLTPGGTVLSDRTSIEKAIAGRIKAGWTEETVNAMEAHAAGDAVWTVGQYSLTGSGESKGKQIGGHYAEILTRDQNAWHIRMLIGNLTPSQDVTGMAASMAPK
ncbi:MAG TPA: nuclear transport factor 2 family protein [Rhodopila sp.]